MSRREMLAGSPCASSSPLSTAVISASFSTPAACMAFSAYSMSTRPPFMSFTPGPVAMLPFTVYVWNGLVFSNTVSMCPISSIRFPQAFESGPSPAGHLCSATRTPALSTSSIGIHCTANPSPSNSDVMIFPTARTPSRLCVPLLMSTSFSSSAFDSPACASIYATIAFSCGDKGGALCATAPNAKQRLANTRPTPNQKRFRIPGA